MTPNARVATAAEIIDAVAGGMAAEQALIRWARASRHAGSKDRAAVRDHVFDVLRRWWSTAWAGGGTSGRARMIGLFRTQGADPEPLFDGSRYGPAPLTPSELAEPDEMPETVALDCPAWLEEDLRSSLGANFADVLEALRHRAPLMLRVNPRLGNLEAARSALAGEEIEAEPHSLSPTALMVTRNPRRVVASRTFAGGLVEVQDAASQAVVDLLPLKPGSRVLDYCAGGGGKTLAMAGRAEADFYAHDANPARMAGLHARAARAGVAVETVAPAQIRDAGHFDLVLVDAPCSGSGAWRRTPEGKIRLDRSRLDHLTALQGHILDEAAARVAIGGTLAYATCSLLAAENTEACARFLERNHGFEAHLRRSFTPLDGGDGFYVQILNRRSG